MCLSISLFVCLFVRLNFSNWVFNFISHLKQTLVNINRCEDVEEGGSQYVLASNNQKVYQNKRRHPTLIGPVVAECAKKTLLGQILGSEKE